MSKQKNPFLSRVCVCVYACVWVRRHACVCWNAREAAFDSTQNQLPLKITKKVHQNSGKESMDTCFLVSGGILKSCLVIILQKSQIKGKITNYNSYQKQKNRGPMGLWNRSLGRLGARAFKVPLGNIHIQACLPFHTVRVPT